MKNKHLAATLVCLVLLAGTSHANIVEVGRIDFTGNFTLNHNYNFNNPSAHPFGSFGDLTALDATGIFASNVMSGDTLTLNTPNVVDPGMVWMIDGFTIASQNGTLSIAGADSGRFVSALADLSGNGFDPSSFNIGFGDAFTQWFFTAPPYNVDNFPSDVTGPIQLTITAAFENGHVPETGWTIAFLAFGIVALVLVRQAQKIQLGR